MTHEDARLIADMLNWIGHAIFFAAIIRAICNK
jgi:hypothetical protein